MTRAEGKYATAAAGGRDLTRHMRVTDALFQAMVRHELHAQFGVQFSQREVTGQWDIIGIPEEAIGRFSRCREEGDDMLSALGFDRSAVSAAQARTRKLSRGSPSMLSSLRRSVHWSVTVKRSMRCRAHLGRGRRR